MAFTFPKPFQEAVIRNGMQHNRQISVKLHQLLPDLAPEESAYFRLLIEEFDKQLIAYLSHGSLEPILPTLRQVCRTTALTGLSLEVFIQVIFEADAAQRKAMLAEMPCDPRDMHYIFLEVDKFRDAVVDEFIRARSEHWERIQKQTAKIQSEFFGNLPFPAFTGTADLVIRNFNVAVSKAIPIGEKSYAGLHLEEWMKLVQVEPARIRQLMEKLGREGFLLQEDLPVYCDETDCNIFFLISVNFVHDLEGFPIGFQAMLEDITQLKSLEKQLSSQMAQLQSVFYSCPVGLIFVDSNRVIQRINPEACRLLNYPPPDQIEQGDMAKIRSRIKNSHKNPEEFMELLDEVYSDPEITKEGVMETIRPPRRVSYTVSPVRDLSDRPIGWFWIFVDITQREANESLKRDLTNMIVHDLKNPLTAIVGAVYVLRQMIAEREPKAVNALELMKRNCDRMMGMIMNMLDIERLETDKLELQLQDVSLRSAMTGVIQSQKHAAGQRSLKLEMSEDTEDCKIMADPNLLERVMANLINNAVKHTNPINGRIVVRVSGNTCDEIRIDVVDNGEGIPKEFHKKIFEKFGQAELRRQDHKTDTGLGLTFCRLAVEAHGGTISVKSEPGHGSMFTVRLPSVPQTKISDNREEAVTVSAGADEDWQI